MKTKGPHIYSLNEYGLRISDLKSIFRKIHVRVYFKRYGKVRHLSKFSSKERRYKLYERRRSLLKNVLKLKFMGNLKIIGSKVDPHGLEGWLDSKHVHELRNNAYLGDIFINKVKGLRKKLILPKYTWY